MKQEIELGKEVVLPFDESKEKYIIVLIDGKNISLYSKERKDVIIVAKDILTEPEQWDAFFA